VFHNIKLQSPIIHMDWRAKKLSSNAKLKNLNIL